MFTRKTIPVTDHLDNDEIARQYLTVDVNYFNVIAYELVTDRPECFESIFLRSQPYRRTPHATLTKKTFTVAVNKQTSG